MNKDRGALLFLAHGGMELSWRYAWASFLLNSIAHRSFPLPEAIGSFFLAAALYRLLRGIGLRMVAVLGIHILGFFVAASTFIYAFNYRAYPYFDTGWLLAFWGQARDSMEWLILVILLFLALLFWLAGVALARRPLAHLTLCNRFDSGVAAFFCLFIVKSLLLIKGGIEVRDSAPVLLLFPFFIFSLLAIGLARNRNRERREFLAGYSGIGALVSFILVVLTFGAGMVLFLMTYLSAAAEAGYAVLKSATGPLGPVLVRVLLFLFGKEPRQDLLVPATDRNEAQYIPSGESSWWSERVQELMAWGLLGLGLLIGLILCALGTWYLMRWLLSRTPKEKRKQIHWQLVLVWVQNLWAAIGRGIQWALQRLTGYRDTVQLYRAFLKWGRRSGLPQLLSETPDEYGSRLTKRFPALAAEIRGIVNAFNLAVYGELALNDAQMALTKLSWRRMCSPRYWPARLKSWFFR